MTTTDQEIMEATYRVLVERGYAALSMRRIAEEFDGSQSLIYYHYGDKETLLGDFLGFLIEEFEAELDAIDDSDPGERLRRIVDLVLPSIDDPDHVRFRQTLMEIRAQTPHNERYGERFEAIDTKLQSELEATIQRGLDDGTLGGVTPQEGAERLLLFMYGVTDRYVPVEDWDGIERGREYLDAELRRWETEAGAGETE
jgi:AcrR family transcriptional regulator